VFLIDCITIWVLNLLFNTEKMFCYMPMNWQKAPCGPGVVIMVSGEAGSGIIADNPLSRWFVHLLGGTNQILAAAILIAAAKYTLGKYTWPYIWSGQRIKVLKSAHRGNRMGAPFLLDGNTRSYGCFACYLLGYTGGRCNYQVAGGLTLCI